MTRQFYWHRILNYKAQFLPGPKSAFRLEDGQIAHAYGK
jgi:hypothetical protein